MHVGQAVLVLDAFTIRQWVDNKPLTIVYVLCSSVAEKATFFRKFAENIQENKTGWEKISGMLSPRPTWPRP